MNENTESQCEQVGITEQVTEIRTRWIAEACEPGSEIGWDDLRLVATKDVAALLGIADRQAATIRRQGDKVAKGEQHERERAQSPCEHWNDGNLIAAIRHEWTVSDPGERTTTEARRDIETLCALAERQAAMIGHQGEEIAFQDSVIRRFGGQAGREAMRKHLRELQRAIATERGG